MSDPMDVWYALAEDLAQQCDQYAEESARSWNPLIRWLNPRMYRRKAAAYRAVTFQPTGNWLDDILQPAKQLYRVNHS